MSFALYVYPNLIFLQSSCNSEIRMSIRSGSYVFVHLSFSSNQWSDECGREMNMDVPNSKTILETPFRPSNSIPTHTAACLKMSKPSVQIWRNLANVERIWRNFVKVDGFDISREAALCAVLN